MHDSQTEKEEKKYILQDEEKNEDMGESSDHSSLPQASFNFINSIVGSGIIGMAYALNQAGILVGTLIFIALGIITDYSLLILVKSSHLSGTNSYQAVMHAAFGTSGYVLLSILQFVYPLIAMISYNVIAGDTITKVIAFYADLEPTSPWARRELIIAMTTIFVSLPLSLYREMKKFSRISFISLLITGFVLFAIFLRLFTFGLNIPKSDDAWKLISPGVTQAIAITSFAFMCHHSTFLVYGSLKQPSEQRWKQLTHISLMVSTSIEILFGIFGYATFTGFVQGDLLENYCRGDHLINAVRILFSITVLMTYPIECFVARDIVIHTLLDGRFSDSKSNCNIDKQQIIVTTILTVVTSLLSFTTDCLGIVLELNGIFAAIPLAYILPALCYLRLEPSPWWSLHKVPVIFMGIFGILVTVCGTAMMILNWEEDSTCSHGKEMFYCTSLSNTTVGHS